MKRKNSPITKPNPIQTIKVSDGTVLERKKCIVLIVLLDRYVHFYVYDKNTQLVNIIRSTVRTLNTYKHLLNEQFEMVNRQVMVNPLFVAKVTTERKLCFKVKINGDHYMSVENYAKFINRQ